MKKEESILHLIAISPDARRRWNSAIKSFSKSNNEYRFKDEEAFPEERAVIGGDGLMAIKIVFEDGSELEMKFGSGDWRWLRRNVN